MTIYAAFAMFAPGTAIEESMTVGGGVSHSRSPLFNLLALLRQVYYSRRLDV